MQTINFCIDLIEDTNKTLVELANQFLDVVMKFDNDIGERVKYRRFMVHNKHWVESM